MPSTAPSPHRTRRHRRRRVHSPRGCRRASTRSATHHPDGSLAGFSYGNGIVHSRTRNTRGLPARMWDSLWGVSRFDHSYAYDAHGNLTQLTDGVDYSENRFMAYDSRDRLTQANAPYLYGEEIFDYDALDNVRRAAIYPLGGGSYLLDYRFVYDANQRLDRINDAIGTLLWDYSHNALGETTWRAGAGNTWSYAWSAVGRMTQGGNESYVYDAHGHRSRATRSGTGSTRYQVHNRSGKLLYVEDSRDDQRIDYLHLGNKLIAQRSRPLYGSTATVTYHHTDHLGSASVETNASGTQTQRTLRTPYGSPYDGTYREGPGFAGHVTDTATNLTYMQQRYYDPVAMRFISTDPVDVSGANGGNFNRYWYGNNNPYSFTDPDGRLSRGTGWSDKEWKHFDRAQQSAANNLEKAASKLTNAMAEGGKALQRAEKSFERNFGTGTATTGNMTQAASDMSAMAAALRDTGANAIPANAMTSQALAAAYPGIGSDTLAGVPTSGPPQVIVNTSHPEFNNFSILAWGAAHETGHAVLGYKDQNMNGVPAYKLGTPQQRKIFKTLPSHQRLINPDHLLEYAQ